jgi:hypothetical protein
MPYITKERRDALTSLTTPDADINVNTAGELNFVLTAELLEYVKNKGLNYQTINDIVGALEGAKAEFQRRVVAPYEDTKIQSNGDIY